MKERSLSQLGESNSCFPWAYGAQCFFAVGRFGQSLLLFLFELAAGCMFVLKLSEQIENQLIIAAQRQVLVPVCRHTGILDFLKF